MFQLYGCNAEGDTYLGQQAMLNIKVETSNTTGNTQIRTNPVIGSKSHFVIYH